MERNLQKSFFAIFLPVFVLCSLPAESSYDYKTEFRKTYEVKPGTAVTVANQNGKVEIEKWDKDEIEIFAVIGSNKSMKELSRVKIEVSINENMEIETIYSGKSSSRTEEGENDFGLWDFIKWIIKEGFTGEKTSVDYEIKVPASVIVSAVNTSNGRIHLNGTKGPSELSTTNGRIEVENTVGNVEARTTNGRVEVENADGFVTVGTTNGRIKVKECKGIKAVNTTNGSIEVEIKDIEGMRTEIGTTNGSIKLGLSSSLNAEIELSTTNGGIDVKNINFEVVSKNKNKYLKGKIGKGGPDLNASTTNGNIEVREL